MTGIGARLRASLRFDAINGNDHEREVVANQIREAADLLDKLHEQKAELVKALRELLECYDPEAVAADKRTPETMRDFAVHQARAALAAVGEET